MCWEKIFSFSKLLEDKNEIFYWWGLWVPKRILGKCDNVISLSNLTFAHKVATLVLSEQILGLKYYK